MDSFTYDLIQDILNKHISFMELRVTDLIHLLQQYDRCYDESDFRFWSDRVHSANVDLEYAYHAYHEFIKAVIPIED